MTCVEIIVWPNTSLIFTHILENSGTPLCCIFFYVIILWISLFNTIILRLPNDDMTHPVLKPAGSQSPSRLSEDTWLKGTCS